MTTSTRQARGFRRWGLVSVLTAVLVSSPRLQVAMQAVDGDLDATFGNGGRVVTNVPLVPGRLIQAVALQADGKIVVAGNGFGAVGSTGFALARYDTNGTLDPSFGGDGFAVVEFPGPGQGAQAFALAIQADGRIVVAGNTTRIGANPFDLIIDVAVARVLPDGTPDASFDGDGRAVTNLGGANRTQAESAFALAIQPDGKIVAAGTRSLPDFSSQFALVRYNADGSPDVSFDSDGVVITTFGFSAGATGVGLQSDGTIVAGGGGNLARYLADGALDPSFGVNGQSSTPGVGGVALVIQPDDRIVMAGSVIQVGTDFSVARFDADGALDPTFNSTGVAIFDLGRPIEGASAVALQADGKIVVAGTSFTNGTDGGDFVVLRYATDGVLDASFGTGGVVLTDFDNGNDTAAGVAIQIDGKIVVAGTTLTEGIFGNLALARYDGPPPHPLTFFLHGADVPGTAGGLTMNGTPASGVRVSIGTRTWFSDPAVAGSFQPGATFQVTLPCVLGVSLPKTVRLAATNLTGGQEQVLGQAVKGAALCSEQTIGIPVTTPLTLTNKRLKLTITSASPLPVVVPLGNRTFLRAGFFVGAP